MTQTKEENRPVKANGAQLSWGPKLFVSVLLAILAFFYWLLIYSGGSVIHHG